MGGEVCGDARRERLREGGRVDLAGHGDARPHVAGAGRRVWTRHSAARGAAREDSLRKLSLRPSATLL